MKAFKYTLDKSSKKFLCPSCNKKTYVRYRDIEGNFIDDKFGRCDREVNCGHFLRPEDDKPVFVPTKRREDKPPSFIPLEFAINTYRDYEQNSFTKWLFSLFDEPTVEKLIEQYRFGVDDTGPYTKDWTIFWQYDIHNKIRSGKIIKYMEDGHRDKEHNATWFHKKFNVIDQFPDFNLKQCLFGEHLLPSTTKPIALVESEKTALIASVYIDRYTWVACGGKTQLTSDKVAPLRNRSVTLFPDLGAYEDWSLKGKEFGFNVSDHLEKIATKDDREQGLDLADFLLRYHN